jgi:hypothetical protein
VRTVCQTARVEERFQVRKKMIHRASRLLPSPPWWWVDPQPVITLESRELNIPMESDMFM